MTTVQEYRDFIVKNRNKGYTPRLNKDKIRYKIEDINGVLHYFKRDANYGFWENLGEFTEDIAQTFS